MTQEAPATLVITIINGSRSCKVNLVPTFKLSFSMISRDQQQNVKDMRQQFGLDLPPASPFYKAIALPGAEKLVFDLSQVEECLALSWGCFKKVVKLMEHLRKVKGGSWFKLSTKLLKVCSKATQLKFRIINSITDLYSASGSSDSKSFLVREQCGLKSGEVLHRSFGHPSQWTEEELYS